MPVNHFCRSFVENLSENCSSAELQNFLNLSTSEMILAEKVEEIKKQSVTERNVGPI
jgi:hypothetical protein